MSPRLLGFAIVPLFAAATAHAQAPGEMEPSESQPVAESPQLAVSSVMTRRFAIGLSVGSLELSPKNNPEANTTFATAQLSIRFRATPHFELELALAGGAQKYEDGSDGELAMDSATLGARYRFRPEAKWNWWLMAGLGKMVVAYKNSTSEQRDQLSRPHGTVGIGIERRWRALAIQAELRGIGMGENQDDTMNVPYPEPDPRGGALPPDMKVPPGTTTSAYGPQSGGTATIGASFYF